MLQSNRGVYLLDNKDRKYTGKYWNPRYLRGIQCILNATHGVVSPKRKFFEAAFGRSVKEFMKLILMPDDYIIYREDHKHDGAAEWNKTYNSLSKLQQKEFLDVIFKNQFSDVDYSKHPKVNSLLSHYK
jgi:hypothetical protein